MSTRQIRISERTHTKRSRIDLPSSHIARLLRDAGMRPTRQRLALASILFRAEPRHVTAVELHSDAITAGASLSLATVYNTLNQFAERGLLNKLSVSGEQTYFDTDVSDHHHFWVEAENRIVDVSPDEIEFGRLPNPPAGYCITKIDVVVVVMRIEPKLPLYCLNSTTGDCTKCSRGTS